MDTGYCIRCHAAVNRTRILSAKRCNLLNQKRILAHKQETAPGELCMQQQIGGGFLCLQLKLRQLCRLCSCCSFLREWASFRMKLPKTGQVINVWKKVAGYKRNDEEGSTEGVSASLPLFTCLRKRLRQNHRDRTVTE